MSQSAYHLHCAGKTLFRRLAASPPTACPLPGLAAPNQALASRLFRLDRPPHWEKYPAMTRTDRVSTRESVSDGLRAKARPGVKLLTGTLTSNTGFPFVGLARRLILRLKVKAPLRVPRCFGLNDLLRLWVGHALRVFDGAGRGDVRVPPRDSLSGAPCSRPMPDRGRTRRPHASGNRKPSRSTGWTPNLPCAGVGKPGARASCARRECAEVDSSCSPGRTKQGVCPGPAPAEGTFRGQDALAPKTLRPRTPSRARKTYRARTLGCTDVYGSGKATANPACRRGIHAGTAAIPECGPDGPVPGAHVGPSDWPKSRARTLGCTDVYGSADGPPTSEALARVTWRRKTWTAVGGVTVGILSRSGRGVAGPASWLFRSNGDNPVACLSYAGRDRWALAADSLRAPFAATLRQRKPVRSPWCGPGGPATSRRFRVDSLCELPSQRTRATALPDRRLLPARVVAGVGNGCSSQGFRQAAGASPKPPPPYSVRASAHPCRTIDARAPRRRQTARAITETCGTMARITVTATRFVRC